MKIQMPVKINVELSLDEMNGLRKMIGETSIKSRMDDFHLTKDESLALNEMYEVLYNLLVEK